jgi:uncharacterized coiled-coil protein SlyX
MKKISLLCLIFYSLSSYAQDTIRIKLNGGGGFSSTLWTQSGNDIFNLNSGNVGIGTIDTKGYRLAVNGDAIFNRVRVKPYANWPDYVFDNQYDLTPLKNLELFIHANNHLPDVPPASEVEKNGFDLGDNQAVLLKKVEELTLYIIEQNKQAEQQQKQINKLQQELNDLKSTIKTGN